MHLRLFVIWCTFRIGNWIVSVLIGTLDKQCATVLVVPGMYLTVMLYGTVFIRSYCILSEASSRLLLRMDTSGLCSVSSVNILP